MSIRVGVGLSIGVNVLGAPDDFATVVDILEDLGFDSLWMSDTVVGGAFDPTTALAFAAGRTERLRLGTNVTVLPGRDPFLVAKQMALLDQLSRGRFIPGFGMGSPSEADRAPFAVGRGIRGRTFDESLSVIRRLWSDGSLPHPDGGAPASIDPRPTRDLDIWLGGRSTTALERVGRLGDGWIGNFQTPHDAGAARAVIHQAAAAAGRSIDDDHLGMTIYYVRESRSPFSLQHVDRAMGYCGCAGPSMSLDRADVARAMLPCGDEELVRIIDQHIEQGISKFVVIPADRPENWDDELGWLRAVTAHLET